MIPRDAPTVNVRPKDAGPFEPIARRLATREIGASEALQQAARLAEAGELSAPRAEALRLLAIAQLQADRWVLAVQVMQVLLAALDAAPGLPHSLAHSVLSAWLEIATRGVWESGDPRLYHDAMTRGEAGVAAATAAGDLEAAAAGAQRLGFLNLDPYVLHRGVLEHEATTAEWARQLRSGHTWDGERLPESPAGPLPAITSAMRLAHAWLARALALGADPLAAGKELALAMSARRTLEGAHAVAADEIVAVVERTAAAFAAIDDPVRLVEVLAVGADAGVPLDVARMRTIVDRPIEPLFDRYPVGDVLMLLRNAAHALRQAGSGADAFALIERHASILGPRLAERDLAAWYTVQNNAMRDRADLGMARAPRGTPIRELWAVFVAQHQAGQWPAALGLTVALQLADRCRAGEEPIVVELLEAALTLEPVLATVWGRAAEYMMALACRQGAHRAQQAGRHDDALVMALGAVFNGLRAREPDVRNAALIDLTRWMADATANGVAVAAGFLRQYLPFLEAELGEADAEIVFDILGGACLAAVRVLPAERAAPLIRLAKGYRFGAAVRSGVARAWAPDEIVRDLEARAAAVLADAPFADLEDRGRLEALEPLLLVTPVVRAAVVSGGASAAERLSNLRHRIDASIEAALAREALAALAASDAAAPPAVLIDADTVFLEFLLTRSGEQEVIIRLATWADGQHVSATLLADGTAPGPRLADNLVLHLREVGASVAQLRNQLQEDAPNNQAAATSALETLTRLSNLLLGDLAPILATLRATQKRRLVIVPHAALHVAPLHLLLVDGAPLVDHWTVTFAPTAWLLVGDTTLGEAVPTRAHAAAAWGAAFVDGELGLDPIPNVRAEIATVTALISGPAWVDNQATAATLGEALQSARRVHIATHGAHDATAPSYHTLFSAPAPSSSGRVHARDLLGLDLRGLELVTMSACETALGRFDFGDNLRGIPAALFLGGAQALIGCLWNVDTRVAETFFAALYAALAADTPAATAFAGAQRQTRRRFPQYRDWGAFYYSARA